MKVIKIALEEVVMNVSEQMDMETRYQTRPRTTINTKAKLRMRRGTKYTPQKGHMQIAYSYITTCLALGVNTADDIWNNASMAEKDPETLVRAEDVWTIVLNLVRTDRLIEDLTLKLEWSHA